MQMILAELDLWLFDSTILILILIKDIWSYYCTKILLPDVTLFTMNPR